MLGHGIPRGPPDAKKQTLLGIIERFQREKRLSPELQLHVERSEIRFLFCSGQVFCISARRTPLVTSATTKDSGTFPRKDWIFIRLPESVEWKSRSVSASSSNSPGNGRFPNGDPPPDLHGDKRGKRNLVRTDG
jgi:hypothetical protein